MRSGRPPSVNLYPETILSIYKDTGLMEQDHPYTPSPNAVADTSSLSKVFRPITSPNAALRDCNSHLSYFCPLQVPEHEEPSPVLPSCQPTFVGLFLMHSLTRRFSTLLVRPKAKKVLRRRRVLWPECTTIERKPLIYGASSVLVTGGPFAQLSRVRRTNTRSSEFG